MDNGWANNYIVHLHFECLSRYCTWLFEWWTEHSKVKRHTNEFVVAILCRKGSYNKLLQILHSLNLQMGVHHVFWFVGDGKSWKEGNGRFVWLIVMIFGIRIRVLVNFWKGKNNNHWAPLISNFHWNSTDVFHVWVFTSDFCLLMRISPRHQIK